jgi:hypothetical protein
MQDLGMMKQKLWLDEFAGATTNERHQQTSEYSLKVAFYALSGGRQQKGFNL